MGTVARRAPTGVPTPGQLVCSRPVRGFVFGPLHLRGVMPAMVVAMALGVAACGSSGPRQDASEPDGSFPVQVTAATFPGRQVLSQHTHMVLTIRNAGSHAIPNLAVTVCPGTCAYPAPPGQGTSSAVFDSNLGSDALNNPSTPVWIVDHPPGPCAYSCQGGGAGSYATAYPDTWALGHPLAPGHTATFDWGVTAVKAGRFVVAWQVAAGLTGKARAVSAGSNAAPQGRFTVEVSHTPTQAYVNDNGQIVTTP